MTTAPTVPEAASAICCAATRVSKLVLFHFPCRCSVTTRIFIAGLRKPVTPFHPARNQGSQLMPQLGCPFGGDPLGEPRRLASVGHSPKAPPRTQITRASNFSFSTSFEATSFGVPVRNSVFFVFDGT